MSYHAGTWKRLSFLNGLPGACAKPGPDCCPTPQWASTEYPSRVLLGDSPSCEPIGVLPRVPTTHLPGCLPHFRRICRR